MARADNSGEHADTLGYDARGKVIRAALGGTLDPYQVMRSVYDRAGALAAMEVRRTSPDTATATEEFTFDGIGNITGTVKNRNVAGIKTTTGAIDQDNGRLTGQYKWAVDSVFQRVDFNAAQGQAVIKSALERFCGAVCQADSVATPPTLTGKGYESMAWHGLDGKMRAFQRVGSDLTPETRFVFEEYRYDALGRRVLLRSRSRASCDSTFCKSAIERYVYDGHQLLIEIRVPGDSGKSDAALEADTSTVSAHYGRIAYLHGGGIDAPIALTRNATTIIPHANWRGFYDAATDSAGNNYTTNINFIGREQDPFLDTKLPTVVNGWSGTLLRAAQDQSGLMYRRNRYYDAETGRFTQVDPIGLVGGPSLFAYAGGDPVNRGDPYGLCDVYLRDKDGYCPGGLSVEEWESIVAAAQNLQPGARTRVLEALIQGRIHSGISWHECFDVNPFDSQEIAGCTVGNYFSVDEDVLRRGGPNLTFVLAHEYYHTFQNRSRVPATESGANDYACKAAKAAQGSYYRQKCT